MRRRIGPGLAARSIALVALGALLGVTAACGSDDAGGDSGDEKVTIRFDWWGNPDRAAVTEKAVDLFEQKNPNITVETSYAEFNAYFQKLATQIAGGGAPGRAADGLPVRARVRRPQRAGRARLPATPRWTSSNVTQQLLSGGTVDGKLYGIPPTQNTQVFSYDAAAVDQGRRRPRPRTAGPGPT